MPGEDEPQEVTEAVAVRRREPIAAVALDFSGRWVWRASGRRGAHLVRERSATSSSSWTLCGKRVRNPRRTWRGLCPSCRAAADRVDAEATPRARYTP